MRRLLTFGCEGKALGASLDEASGGSVGVLLPTGGSQTRIGSHRMYERLSRSLAQNGFSCFRYDRRGVGDSEGDDPGYLESGSDVAAAGAAFRLEAPAVKRLYGFGLCDGATAIALFGERAGLDGMILVNPWLVEAQADAPPPAAVRAHYLERLKSAEGWKRLLTGSVDYRKLLTGVSKIVKGDRDTSLAAEVASALKRSGAPVELITAQKDATAIAAEDAMKAPAFEGLRIARQSVASDSHTFARPGDEEKLLAATLTALRRLSSQAG
jgi:exosortase A-associated hydrolase 1